MICCEKCRGPVEQRCYCGSRMFLREGRYGLFYGCERHPECEGLISAKANGAPLGKPADKATRAARRVAYHTFREVWERGFLSEADARVWLKNTKLQVESVADLDAAGCEVLLEALRETFRITRVSTPRKIARSRR